MGLKSGTRGAGEWKGENRGRGWERRDSPRRRNDVLSNRRQIRKDQDIGMNNTLVMGFPKSEVTSFRLTK